MKSLTPFEDPLVFRKMIEFLSARPINIEMNKWKRVGDKCKWRWDKPPKEGDGSWHMKMTLYDPDGEKFERSYHTKKTDRKLKPKFDPKDVLNEELTRIT